MTAIEKLLTDHLDLWAATIKRKPAVGRGSSGKSELYGIKKLRELIIELAVRGLLVPQDSRDEPASELLKKIAAEKAKLVKEGKLKKENTLPAIAPSEKPFQLPSNWIFARWGQIADWAVGSGFPTAAQGEVDQEVLFAKVSDMNLLGNEKYIVTTVNSISIKTAEKIKAKAHPPGTVVFPKIGGAIATNKRRILARNTAIDNNCLGLTPRSGITTDYLYLLLSSVDLSVYQSGTSVPSLSQGSLELIVAGLPPLPEQHRIVARVNELMALCDQLEQQTDASLSAHQTLVEISLNALISATNHTQLACTWERIAEHFDILFNTEGSIDQLKQTILQLAVMGKLVPQDPNDEPASELLKKIVAEKAKLVKEGRIKKDNLRPTISDEERSFHIPASWIWVRLGEVGNTQTGATPKQSDAHHYGNDVPFIKPGDISDGKIISYENDGLSFDGAIDLGRIAQSDSVLMVCIGTIGKCARVDRAVAFNQQINSVSPYLPMGHYIKVVLQSNYFQSLAWEHSSSTTISILNKGKWENILFPLAPLAEQHRIVAKVNELMVLCEQIKVRLNDLQTIQLHLADAMVEKVLARL